MKSNVNYFQDITKTETLPHTPYKGIYSQHQTCFKAAPYIKLSDLLIQKHLASQTAGRFSFFKKKKPNKQKIQTSFNN